MLAYIYYFLNFAITPLIPTYMEYGIRDTEYVLLAILQEK